MITPVKDSDGNASVDADAIKIIIMIGVIVMMA